MSSYRLASGYNIPVMGFGLWKIPRNETADVVYKAIQFGYRQFDGAYDYQNEMEAGEGIRRAIKDGIVKREEVFVTTKLWNPYHSKEHALKLAKIQNEKWGLGYIDLYLIHFPVSLKYVDPQENEYPGWWTDKAQTTIETSKVPMHETWEALESLVDLGIVRSIGLSNCTAQLVMDVQKYARHPVSVLECELHPYLTQQGLVQFAQENGIRFIAYCSFGPQSFSELPGAFSELTKPVEALFHHELIKNIATKYGVSAAQVLLRWSTQRGIIVIPKATDDALLTENLQHFQFDLTEAEIEAICGLNKNLRFNDPGYYFKDHPLRIF